MSEFTEHIEAIRKYHQDELVRIGKMEQMEEEHQKAMQRLEADMGKAPDEPKSVSYF